MPLSNQPNADCEMAPFQEIFPDIAAKSVVVFLFHSVKDPWTKTLDLCNIFGRGAAVSFQCQGSLNHWPATTTTCRIAECRNSNAPQLFGEVALFCASMRIAGLLFWLSILLWLLHSLFLCASVPWTFCVILILPLDRKQLLQRKVDAEENHPLLVASL